MNSKRLGLGLLTTLAAMTLAACDDTSPTAVDAGNAPTTASYARGGKPASITTGNVITISPSSVEIAAGALDTLHITYTDSKGNLTAENDGRVFWYGCKPVDPAMSSCLNNLGIMPIYPTLRSVQLKGMTAGVYTVWVDDGMGRKASSTVTVQ